MPKDNPTSITDYIHSAPILGQAHLLHIYTLLKGVAPDAQEAIKWGTPFFIEPRFLFAFSAHKAHLNFSPSTETLKHFSKDLQEHATTQNLLRLPYHRPLPEELIQRMAEHRLALVEGRTDDSFW